jgi:hypothetical protein
MCDTMRHLFVLLLLTANSWTESGFVCPDTKAQQACNSFRESTSDQKRLKAGNVLVCFREQKDEYFFIEPKFPTVLEWDQKTSTASGFAIPSADTIDHGVASAELMPSLYIDGLVFRIGRWRFLNFGGVTANFELQSDDKPPENFGFSISDETLDLSIPYKNQEQNAVTYNLSVTLATRRFKESWRGTPGLPADDYGRCWGGISLPSEKQIQAISHTGSGVVSH